MKKFYTLILVLITFCLPVSAHAMLYTYDFGSLPQGSYEGATLDFMTLTSEQGTLENILNISMIGLAGNDPWTAGATADIYLDFSIPIDFISITAGEEGGDLDKFGISLYEFGTSNFLDSFTTPEFTVDADPDIYTLSASSPNIGRVVFDPGNSTSWPGTIDGAGGQLIFEIAYNTAPVPEPATMFLLGSGLVGLAAFRRKSRKK